MKPERRAGWWARLRGQLRRDDAPAPPDTAPPAELHWQLTLAREQSARLQAVLEQASDAIITIDATQRVQFFNRAASTMFGVAAHEALGEPLDRFIPTDRQLAHRLHVESFRRTGATARHMGRLHSLAGRRADGEVFPIEASISRSGEGEAQLLTVVLRDVGAQREAEARQAAQWRAEAQRQAMAEFVARMSHEMRAPLNAVLGFSQLLQTDEHEPLAPGQRQRVELIRAAGWHLLCLLADASDLSVLESGALRLELASVALPALVDEALPGAVVLYIEDNPVNVLLVEQLLARWPQIGLVQADDGRAGLELARRLRPDLVLLDMHLPDMDGFALLAQLRADPATAVLPVVALSASAEPGDAQRARDAGALEYWTKPLDMRSFHADVVRVLGARVSA